MDHYGWTSSLPRTEKILIPMVPTMTHRISTMSGNVGVTPGRCYQRSQYCSVDAIHAAAQDS